MQSKVQFEEDRRTSLPIVEYPFHDQDMTVTERGRICLDRRNISLNTVLAGQNLVECPAMSSQLHGLRSGFVRQGKLMSRTRTQAI
jgi:hypothetical protein